MTPFTQRGKEEGGLFHGVGGKLAEMELNKLGSVTLNGKDTGEGVGARTERLCDLGRHVNRHRPRLSPVK